MFKFLYQNLNVFNSCERVGVGPEDWQYSSTSSTIQTLQPWALAYTNIDLIYQNQLYIYISYYLG